MGRCATTVARRVTVRRSSSLLAAVPPVLTLAGMIATPLVRRGGGARRALSSVVVGGLFATTAHASARRWGTPRAAVAATTIVGATTMVEHVGTCTGMPFGAYSYGRALRPTIVGVPAIVPLAWFAMAVPARETAHSALGRRSTPVARIAVGAAALTAWDLFLDPQMVAEGLWQWSRGGRYRGIPATNYVGWLLTAAAVMAALEIALPPTETADGALVGEYGVMAAMETLGFARFFGDRVVAAVGGAGMLPVAALAAWRMLRRG
jgi:uncharacterized membrane protein